MRPPLHGRDLYAAARSEAKDRARAVKPRRLSPRSAVSTSDGARRVGKTLATSIQPIRDVHIAWICRHELISISDSILPIFPLAKPRPVDDMQVIKPSA